MNKGMLIGGIVTLAFMAQAGPFQANGIKIGEVDQTSAMIWTRLTTVAVGDHTNLGSAAPGENGEVRVEYWPQDNPAATTTTSWLAVDAGADYTRQFALTGLTARTQYELRVESRPAGGGSVSSTVDGSFRTAPVVDQVVPVLITAVTGQGFGSVDAGSNGYKTYQAMLSLAPDFFVHTGDVLYYDKDDYNGTVSDTVAEAKDRWNAMFSLGYSLEFYRQTAAYFIKDDHDTLKNDCEPGQTYGSLTFAEGVQIFHEQTPSGPSRYRTFRWGKDIQIWMTENREYRDSNSAPDGPDKTIWGETQKAWFTNSVAASDATFKLLVSPGAVVGPDKIGKSDNHANPAFQTEGAEIRQFIAEQGNMYIVCGDRHWQYASIDPVTEAREYCTGAINGVHALRGGSPGYNVEMHSYYGVRGGFLSILVDREAGQPQITFRWHDIDDIDPQTDAARIVYEETLRPYDFGLVTITKDHIAGDVAVQFMSRKGKEYRVEASTNLVDWIELADGLEARGSLIEYQDSGAMVQYDRRFYRVVEMDPQTPHLALFAEGSNGSLISNSMTEGEEFNRADFILDLQFTTPADLGADSDFLLFETGGEGRGTLIALQDGKLGITGGRDGQSVVNYLGPTALSPSTRYSLRINAVSEPSAGSDSFVADFWTEGQGSAVTIMNETGLALDGFSGNDEVGVGLVNDKVFSAGLSLPTTQAPSSMLIEMQAYDPDEATAQSPIPDQPAP